MSEPIIPVHKFYDKSKDKRVYDLFIQDSCFESEFSSLDFKWLYSLT